MCKLIEDYGNRIAKEVAEEAAKKAEKAAKEAAKKEKEKERKNTITALLKKNMTPEWIHETLNIPIELINQIASSLKISK